MRYLGDGHSLNHRDFSHARVIWGCKDRKNSSRVRLIASKLDFYMNSPESFISFEARLFRTLNLNE